MIVNEEPTVYHVRSRTALNDFLLSLYEVGVLKIKKGATIKQEIIE